MADFSVRPAAKTLRPVSTGWVQESRGLTEAARSPVVRLPRACSGSWLTAKVVPAATGPRRLAGVRRKPSGVGAATFGQTSPRAVAAVMTWRVAARSWPRRCRPGDLNERDRRQARTSIADGRQRCRCAPAVLPAVRPPPTGRSGPHRPTVTPCLISEFAPVRPQQEPSSTDPLATLTPRETPVPRLVAGRLTAPPPSRSHLFPGFPLSSFSPASRSLFSRSFPAWAPGAPELSDPLGIIELVIE